MLTNSAKKLSLLIVFCTCLLFCSKDQNQTISKDTMDQLIAEEKKKEDNAKYDPASAITIITDSAEVNAIRREIDKKISDAKLKLPEKSDVEKLVTRYTAGDKTVVPQLVSILKGTNTDQKIELYKNLNSIYDEENCKTTISETELINCIFSNVTNESEESYVIQIAGMMQLKGYEKLFENILLKGTSKEQDRLIYWLSKSGKNARVLSYLEKKVLVDKVNLVEHSDIVWGLQCFAEKGSDTLRQRAYEICLEIYNKKMIDSSHYLVMKNSWSSENPAVDVVTVLMNYGDYRSVSIALDLLNMGIEKGPALTALLKLDRKKYYPLLLQYLRDKETFDNGFYAAVEDFKLTKDTAIVEELLSQYEKRGDHSSRYIGFIVDKLIEIGAKKTLEKIDVLIQDSALVTEMKKAVRIATCTANDIVNDLIRLNIVDKKVKKRAMAQTIRTSNDSQNSGSKFDILDSAGICYYFDSEADEIPVPYDSLIDSLLAHSNGKLTNAKVLMEVTDVESDEVTYTITLIANNKAYIAKPEDNGDWFSVETVLTLLNTALSDANMKERYVFIDTGDQYVQVMFGPENGVKEFISLYNL